MPKKRPSQNDKDLNPKELAFCYEYIANKFNGTAAAIEAGYAPKSAGVTASKLLNRTNVKHKIEKLTKKHINKLSVTAEMIIAELAKLGFSDLENHSNFNGEELTFKPFEEMGSQTACIKKIKTVTKMVPGDDFDDNGKRIMIREQKIDFELHEKKGALELLGKNMGLFNGDKDENEDPPGTTYNYTYDD